MTLTFNESTFLGVGFELIVYGAYIFLFITAFMYLTWWRKTESVHVFYLVSCCFLFSCCTVHVFIGFRYLYKDLVQAPTGVLEAGTPALRTADALVTLIDFFAQIVLIYRLWAIWNRNYYIIIFPCIVSLASVSCAMATIGLLVATPTAAIIPAALVPLGTAAFAIPLGFNTMVTGLITGRIWYLWKQRHMDLVRSGAVVVSRNYLRETLAIIVESGMLYLLVQLVLLILVALNHPAQILVSDIATQVYGIAPTLIFVRVGLGNAIRGSNRGEDGPSRAMNSFGSNGKVTGLGSTLSATESRRPINSPIVYTTAVVTHKDQENQPWKYELQDIRPSNA